MALTAKEKIQKTYTIVHDSFSGLRLQSRTKWQLALIAAPFAWSGVMCLSALIRGIYNSNISAWLIAGNIFVVLASLVAITGIFLKKMRETIWPVFLMISVSAFVTARVIILYISLLERENITISMSSWINSSITLGVLFVPLLFLNKTQIFKILASWLILFIVFLLTDLIMYWNPSPEILVFSMALTLSLIFFPKVTVKLITACVAVIVLGAALFHINNGRDW